jgi:hypothetical protein
MAAVERVQVWRGVHGDPVPLFGPLPGVRAGDTLAYEFELPARFIPWPRRTPLERVFVLLDIGVSMSLPPWRRMRTINGGSTPGVDADHDAATSWYVDLVDVTVDHGTIIVRDLLLDVIVPTDGRHHRLLDLDEYADAIAAGQLPIDVAVDGLRRWQQFLDRHLHADRDPRHGWTDFPPQRIGELAALPAPLGPPVTNRNYRFPAFS